MLLKRYLDTDSYLIPWLIPGEKSILLPYILMKPDTNLFESEMSIKVEFPFTVTTDIVSKLIKRTDNMTVSQKMLYI